MGRSVEEIGAELERLMREQVTSLRAHTFGGLTKNELEEEAKRLKRIREVSADYLAALRDKQITQHDTLRAPKEDV